MAVQLVDFEYCQIWLEILMHDLPLQQHHKLKKRTLQGFEFPPLFIGSFFLGPGTSG